MDDPWLKADPWGGSATASKGSPMSATWRSDRTAKVPATDAPPSAAVIEVAEKIIQAIVCGGASRQVVAASSVALLTRTLQLEGAVK